MSEPKFTPGPWSILFSDKTKVVLEKGGVAIFVADTDSGFVRSKEEQEANATLISVAPELLRELKRHCTLCQLRNPECENCKDCPTQTVLKKARYDK